MSERYAGIKRHALGKFRRKKLSSVDPATMTPSRINAELDRLEAYRFELNDRMIADGRGHEKPSETRKKSDPLALEINAVLDRKTKVQGEITIRMGPAGKWVSRMPRGFKKRR